MKKLLIVLAGIIVVVVIARVVILRYQDTPKEYAGLAEVLESWKGEDGMPEGLEDLQKLLESWKGEDGMPEGLEDLQKLLESWKGEDGMSEGLENLEKLLESWKNEDKEFSVGDWIPEGKYDIETDAWFEKEKTVMSGSQESVQLSQGPVDKLVLQAAGCKVEIVNSEISDMYLAFENLKKVQAYQNEGTVVVKAVRDTQLKQESTDSVLRLYLPLQCPLEAAELEIGAGSLHIDSLCAETLKVLVEAGKLTVGALTGEALEVTLGAGLVSLDEIQVHTAKFSVGAGSMRLSGRIHGNVEAECIAGELQMHLQGNESDYDYELHSVAGNIRLGEKKYAGMNEQTHIDNKAEAKMNLDCIAGNVEVYFE